MRLRGIWLLAAALPVEGQYSLVGDAHMRGETIRLTRARNNVGGAVWRPDRQPLAGGFVTEFTFRISGAGGLGKGADGLAFVVQNSGPDALAGFGGAGGFAAADGIYNSTAPGIPFSLAVFFDTFRNSEGGDPSDNFLTVAVNGHPGEVKWPPSRLALVRKLPFKLKDGKPHRARIEFAPPHLNVRLDGARRPVLTAIVDLAPMLDPGGKAYVGFTASTGGGYANHDIEHWDWRPDVSSSISAVSSQITFALAECLPGRNLCTPSRAAVSEPAPGRFHVVLPGHLEEGASIPNPAGRQPVVTNGKGIVCLGPGEAGRTSCAGPAELLAVRTGGGRTYFEVRGAAAVAPAFRQGFFEFDVEFDQ